MSKTIVSFILFFIALFSITDFSMAEEKNQVSTECQPTYGQYWRSYKWGWYGARRVVKTPGEAKEIIEQIIILNRGVRIGMIRERAHFFIAEITNRKGVVVDLILIDKRTGRIRTMY